MTMMKQPISLENLGPVNESVVQFLYDLGDRISSVSIDDKQGMPVPRTLCCSTGIQCNLAAWVVCEWRRPGPLADQLFLSFLNFLCFLILGVYTTRVLILPVYLFVVYFFVIVTVVYRFFPTITRLSRKKPDVASVDCEHMTTEEADDDRPASTNHAPAPYLRRLWLAGDRMPVDGRQFRDGDGAVSHVTRRAGVASAKLQRVTNRARDVAYNLRLAPMDS